MKKLNAFQGWILVYVAVEAKNTWKWPCSLSIFPFLRAKNPSFSGLRRILLFLVQIPAFWIPDVRNTIQTRLFCTNLVVTHFNSQVVQFLVLRFLLDAYSSFVPLNPHPIVAFLQKNGAMKNAQHDTQKISLASTQRDTSPHTSETKQDTLTAIDKLSWENQFLFFCVERLTPGLFWVEFHSGMSPGAREYPPVVPVKMAHIALRTNYKNLNVNV